MRKYTTDLTYKEFGEDLLITYDLDPLYPLLVVSDMSEKTLKRWLLAYWCFYSAGVCCWIIDQSKNIDYYRAMMEVATAGSDFPRGHERRHFRGQAAIKGVEGLKRFGSPEEVVDAMTQHADFQSVSKAVQTFPMFGPWIGWKIADMAERVLGYPIDFSNADLFMYRDPVKGAALVKYADTEHPMTEEDLREIISMSFQMFQAHLAPPYQDRPINIQEIETILCKYKAYKKGFYPLGNDTFDIMEGLEGWGEFAEHIRDNMYECSAYAIH